MLTIGLDCIGGSGSAYYKCVIPMGDFTMTEVRNGIFDEWKTDNAIVQYDRDKQIWDYDTSFLATFNGTLDAGNIDNDSREIEALRFKRRSYNKLEWTTFAELTYKKEQKTYQVLDRLVQAQEKYEYCVVPVSGNIEGRETIKDIAVEFDGVWIVDDDRSYKMLYEIAFGGVNYNQSTTTMETLTHAYPFITASSINYRSGSLQGLLLSEKSVMNMTLDFHSERMLRENILRFITDRKPKILKDGLGRYYLVMLTNAREIPNNKFQGGVVEVSFDWTEIGDAYSTKDLQDLGLLHQDK